MYKYSFFNDYSEGAHPSLINLLAKTNLEQEDGYGKDNLSQQAKKLIRQELGNPEAAVHFVSGGTQANQIVLASILKSYESVIAADSAHISVHEAGAIEATGHKINTCLTPDGKLTVEQIQSIIDQHPDEHMVKPKVVFISNSTEVGTIYKKGELENIAQICHKNHMVLYLDGARLGSALCSKESDLCLADLTHLVDIFYIGGTKNGALLGEAIVINNKALQPDFRYHLKQRGALLAKGRIIGIQFLGLFTNNLFFDLAAYANKIAEKLSQGIRRLGFQFFTHSTTNQIFPILPNSLISELQRDYGFYIWAKVDVDHSAIRLVTSWATPEDKVTEFLEDLFYLAKSKSEK